MCAVVSCPTGSFVRLNLNTLATSTTVAGFCIKHTSVSCCRIVSQALGLVVKRVRWQCPNRRCQFDQVCTATAH